MHKNAPRRNHPRPPRANPLADCPLTAAFAAIGGKWKLTLIYWLAHDETHFAGLKRRAAPISAKVLTEQLRELEADGIVERDATGPVPQPVIYRLTAYGAALIPLVEQVRVWGAAHLRRRRTESAAPLACAAALVTLR
ncbi:MAG TPA: helix-turn-helix domain-containing protein [Tahibacter sp.]|nr:helix-turn-helix domain-containing protein [Tahibacter sp.]